MPGDIFISYSRKDSSEALDLVERIRAEGMSVWIDLHGIGGAQQWAGEIAGAIKDCSSVLLLISENAVESTNVLREVALASAHEKRILPVILRRTSIPGAFEYHLAGIHYLHYGDFSAIISSLKGSRTEHFPKIRDNRKSLLVLPFEDLSPGQNNGWFSDGLTSELITTLSKIKSLRVIDWNTSKGFKGARGHTRDIARDLDVRYFLEGNVRKFDDQIKISVELLDIDTGEYLWHDAHKGIFADIFEIQEQVAARVATGMKLTLTPEEQKLISERGTENIEAYELYLKAKEAYFFWSHEWMEKSIFLIKKAITLDPKFAEALRLEAIAHLNLYRLWDRNHEHLDRAESLLFEAQKIEPTIPTQYIFLLHILQKRFEEAEQYAKLAIEANPNDFYGYFMLGYCFFNRGNLQESAPAYETAISLRIDSRTTYWNLVEVLDRSGNTEKRTHWAKQAFPLFQKWAVLHPEDQFAQAQLATFQLYTGSQELALATIAPLLGCTNVDGLTLYTISVLYMHIGDHEGALHELGRAIDTGFSHIELVKSDPNFNPVLNTDEYKRIIEKMEKRIQI